MQPRSRSSRITAAGCAAALLALLVPSPADAAVASKKYRLEANKPVGIDLSVLDIKAETVVFEFPSSLLRFQTASRARVTVTNRSGVKARVGVALALFDDAGDLVAAGTGGNKGGWVSPGETEEFSVFFYYVTERIPSATTFQISIEAS
jgi:hypothetical protein